MVKNSITFLSFLLLSSFLFAKSKQQKFIVYFKDKPTTEIVQPAFSEKAILKRIQFNIPFDERDYPISVAYKQQLEQASIQIIKQSNWLNAALVWADEHQLQQFHFIASYQKVENIKQKNEIVRNGTEANKENAETQTFEDHFLSSFPQTHLLNGEYLHEQGFNGENMTIAVCDNGFYNVDSNAAFHHIFEDNRMLGTFDYVHNDSLVYDESGGAPNYTSHGSNCLSFIAGKIDSQYIGTATKSNFYLFHTENNSSERLQEEFNLATALERCVQIGVDVVSISLGYTQFDVASESHDTLDMKLNSTPAAKAVNIASSKGMLVCVAAGNEGAKPWKYISTPSDADSAFCIASVDLSGNVAASSGYGLATDTRVKPNIAAVGVNAKYIKTNGTISTGGGTSYATPQIAGLAACLWQAFPSKTNWEIKTAIEQSASQYLSPDKRIGYGIPDFKKAYQLLATTTAIKNNFLEDDFLVFPNPTQHSFSIKNMGLSTINLIQFYDYSGKMLLSFNAHSTNELDISHLPSGIYFIKVATENGNVVKKIMKD